MSENICSHSSHNNQNTCIIDIVIVVAGTNQVPTKSINECWYNQQERQLLHTQFLGFVHYYSVNRITQVSNSLFSKNTKGVVALAKNGMASAKKTSSTVITSYHNNQVVLYNIFYYFCNVIIISL